MDRQTIYQTVRNHLLWQGAKSEEAGGACLLRGPQKQKCAIGILIPDALYEPSMEGESEPELLLSTHPALRDLLGMGPVYDAAGRRSDDIRFLTELQDIHDRTDPCNWAEALSAMAVSWKLRP